MKKESYTNTYGLLDGEEAVTHPAACRAVAADVSEAFLVVAVRSAERYLLYGLVNDQTLQVHTHTVHQYLAADKHFRTVITLERYNNVQYIIFQPTYFCNFVDDSQSVATDVENCTLMLVLWLLKIEQSS